MRLVDVWPALLPELLRTQHSATGTRIYIFGSMLASSSESSDIDILVVYESEEERIKIKDGLWEVSHYFPLDIIYLMKKEEAEFDFVEEQSAVAIDDLASNIHFGEALRHLGKADTPAKF